MFGIPLWKELNYLGVARFEPQTTPGPKPPTNHLLNPVHLETNTSGYLDGIPGAEKHHPLSNSTRTGRCWYKYITMSSVATKTKLIFMKKTYIYIPINSISTTQANMAIPDIHHLLDVCPIDNIGVFFGLEIHHTNPHLKRCDRPYRDPGENRTSEDDGSESKKSSPKRIVFLYRFHFHAQFRWFGSYEFSLSP